MNEDTLSKYGPSFQAKVISAMVVDTKMMDSLSDIIYPKFFDSDANRWVVETILHYYGEYRKPPSLDVFKVELNKVDDGGLKKKIIEQLRTVYTQQDVSDLEYIKTEFSDFCRNQNLKEVIIQSVDLLKAGQYDRIKDLVDKAMKVGVNSDLGSDYVDTFIDRISDEKRDTIETGWDVLNEVMGGGLGPGELGVVVAPSGVGKTWWLAAIGAAAVKAGKTVVHYTLELSENYVGQRYDTIFTNIPTVNHQEKKDEIINRIKKLNGKLLIKYFPPKGVTTRKLEAHIDKMIGSGNKPDLIIIDYADLMLTNSGRVENTYAEQGGIYIDLRGMGGEYGIPIWTASQTQRCHSIFDKVETPNGVVEIGKIVEGDYVMTHKGYREVTHIFPTETQPVYKITLKSGKCITVSANHRIPTQYGKIKSIETGLKVGDKLFTKKV